MYLTLTRTLILTLSLTLTLTLTLSAWAELVWRYLLEVTNTVDPSSIPGSTLNKLF